MRSRHHVLAVLFAVLLPGLLSAATITVEGSATILVAPEQACISIGIETDADDLAQAEEGNARLARAVDARLRALVPAVQVQSGLMSIGPQRDDQRVVLKQVAHQVITITALPSQVQAVVLAALQSGATHVFDVEYAVKDARPFRDQARVLACKAAREKAELLAGALGAKVGAVNEIRESQNWWWSGRWRSGYWCWAGYWPHHLGGYGGYGYASQNVVSAASSAGEDGVGETQSLSAQVQVVFLLQ